MWQQQQWSHRLACFARVRELEPAREQVRELGPAREQVREPVRAREQVREPVRAREQELGAVPELRREPVRVRVWQPVWEHVHVRKLRRGLGPALERELGLALGPVRKWEPVQEPPRRREPEPEL